MNAATARAESVAPSTEAPDWLLAVSAEDPGRVRDSRALASAARGPWWVALHGVLYDAELLSRELPAITRDASSADVLLAVVERWGVAGLSRLRGVFVAIVADTSDNELIVARDPLGSHPAFFARAGSRFAFAESVQRLLRLPEVSRDLNRAALADHLCHRWPQGTETFFAAVHRVPPGSYVRVRAGSWRTHRYWDPAPPDQPIRWATEEEVAEFPALLDRAVDRCQGTGPAGVFLSGGLDSISVAAVTADRAAAQHLSAPWALSLAMPDPACDERTTQAAIARSLGIPQQLVEFDEAVGPRGLLSAAVDLGGHLSSPLLNIWGPAYLSLAERGASVGVRTILSGSGGDEWLSVSPYLSADLIARRDLAGWFRFLRMFRRSYRHPFWRHLQLATWTFGGRPLASRALARTMPERWRRRRHQRASRRDPQWIAPDPILRQQQLERTERALEDVDPPHGFYVREVRSGMDHALTSWELEEQYEFGRRLGLRFLHPYWDADLVDMLYRTPPRLLTEGGRAKSLVRDTLARRFPTLGLNRQRKVAATSFFQTLVRQQVPQVAATLGRCRRLAALGIIGADAARDYATDGWGSVSNRWDVVNLESWVRANS